MAAPMPRSSLSLAVRCRPCQLSSLSTRSFSTTTSRNAIGPESPKFIEIPTIRQPYARTKQDIKGTLPPPRNLFPNRGPNKVSEEYLSAVARQPSNKSTPPNDYVAWKRRMAASRRESLKEALVELNKRKVQQEAEVATKSAAKRRANEARLNAPQREDERLMNPTITEANSKLQTGFLPDPEREREVAEKARRVQAKEAEREARRRDALHTLYMNARTFITTEEQLDAQIERIFTDEPFPSQPGVQDIWSAKGAPPTVQDLLSKVNHSEKTSMEYHKGPAILTGARMKRIAEELTGGKMD
ncbi:Lipid phosphate phosphatase 2 protein [Rutstroemia sp. NJR-2017a BBW]|nr:Lipid phosphate phosphatase 2 protein [Rutstroemia sp. NJR-2017a BBW]